MPSPATLALTRDTPLLHWTIRIQFWNSCSVLCVAHPLTNGIKPFFGWYCRGIIHAPENYYIVCKLCSYTLNSTSNMTMHFIISMHILLSAPVGLAACLFLCAFHVLHFLQQQKNPIITPRILLHFFRQILYIDIGAILCKRKNSVRKWWAARATKIY